MVYVDVFVRPLVDTVNVVAAVPVVGVIVNAGLLLTGENDPV